MTDIKPIYGKQYPTMPDFLADFRRFDEPPIRTDPASLYFWTQWMAETTGVEKILQLSERVRLRKIKEAFEAQSLSPPRWIREEFRKLDEEGLHASCRLHLLDSEHAPLLFARETRRDHWCRFLDQLLEVDR